MALSQTTPALSIADILQGNDGLTKVSGLFHQIAGRELSPAALQVLAFLEQNGSRDLAQFILDKKRYQASARDLIKFTEVLSPATAHKELLEAQAKAAKAAS
ncbi:hypothetical protein [Kallotenue papyrolyticum]|uniref:hypothetical protein n=1 Tax=Kallotenue papyrolyticum TaxID=1325125 RepID=UPI000492D8DD|nr:hypothetical protein [Kallotenue papyrolyticum]